MENAVVEIVMRCFCLISEAHPSTFSGMVSHSRSIVVYVPSTSIFNPMMCFIYAHVARIVLRVQHNDNLGQEKRSKCVS